MTDDLINWIRAVLDEDERNAPNVHERDCAMGQHQNLHDECVCGRPTRELADVAAKRHLLALHSGSHLCPVLEPGVVEGGPAVVVDSVGSLGDDETCTTVLLLAEPFVERDGYQKEWRVGVPAGAFPPGWESVRP